MAEEAKAIRAEHVISKPFQDKADAYMAEIEYALSADLKDELSLILSQLSYVKSLI